MVISRQICFFSSKLCYGSFEIVKSFKSLIDGRETQERNVVQLAQWFKYCQTDLMRRNLCTTGGSQALFNLAGEERQIVICYRPSLTSLADSRDNLLAGKRLRGS